MSISDRQIYEALSKNPFASDSELAARLNEPLEDVRGVLNDQRNAGIVERVPHATAQLPWSWRFYLTTRGVEEASRTLGYYTQSAYLRAHPMSREWQRLLIGRMDSVSSIYRLAATMSLGAGGLKTRVEFYRKGRFDAMITMEDGRHVGVVRQGRALKRARLNERLRAIHEDEYPRRPGTVLILTPSAWERDTAIRYWRAKAFQGGYVAAESSDALASRELSVWGRIDSVTGGVRTLAEVVAESNPGEERPAASPARKRSSIPAPERMVREAPTFGLSQDEKRVLDIITDHPMIPRRHLMRWLGVSPSRLSQIVSSLIADWGLVERWGRRPGYRYTLSAKGIRYVTYRDRATLATSRGTRAMWSTAPASKPTENSPYEGSLINWWTTHTEHADGETYFLSEVAAEARDAPNSELLWSVPEWRSERKFHWNSRSITPDAVGVVVATGVRIPFYLEYERRSKYPSGIRGKLRPYEHYYWSPDTSGDMPPFPVTLFVVDSATVEDNYVRTAAEMSLTLPIFVSRMPTLAESGILGRSWHPLWEPASPRIRLSDLAGYAWNRLYKRMVWER